MGEGPTANVVGPSLSRRVVTLGGFGQVPQVPVHGEVVARVGQCVVMSFGLFRHLGVSGKIRMSFLFDQLGQLRAE